MTNNELQSRSIVFFGSPLFAVPAFTKLAHSGARLLCVTMPDRPSGRGQRLTPPPIKIAAQQYGIPCLQPETLQDDFCNHIRKFHPDVAVVVAYGKIFRLPLLSIPAFGFCNIHPSLLPRHRGASPIQATILAGDQETGVTIIKCDEGVDTGPILARQVIPLTQHETAGELSETLSNLGADLLVNTLPRYLDGSLPPYPQPTEGVTVAPRFHKDASELDCTCTAQYLERLIRAFAPKPGAWCTIGEQRIKILRASSFSDEHLPHSLSLLVACNDGYAALCTGNRTFLRLEEVQVGGKRACTGDVFLRGHRSLLGAVVTRTR